MDHVSTRKQLLSTEFSVLPRLDPKMRSLYHYISTGQTCEDSWYRNLDAPDDIDNISDFVCNRVEYIDDRDSTTAKYWIS